MNRYARPIVLCAAAIGLVLALQAGVDLAPAKAAPDTALPHRITLAGEPAEMGAALAEAYGDKMKGFLPIFIRAGMVMTGRSKAELYASARTLGRSLHPDDVAEMKAIAEGCGLTYDDVLYVNCFYSLTDSLACRQIAVWGDRSVDGKLMHARNLDWFDYPGDILQRHHLVADYRPAPGKGYRYLVLTWPGLTCSITGANEHGITIGFNQLGSRRGAPMRITEPTFFTIKRALRTCKTVGEAVDLIRTTRPRDNGSIMISGAGEKSAVVVELIDGEVGVRDAGKDFMIGNANHATRASGVKNAPSYGDPDSPTCAVAGAIDGPLGPEQMIDVMRHRRVLQKSNLLSVVFVPADNRMYIAAARMPAARGGFRPYEMFADDPQPTDKKKR